MLGDLVHRRVRIRLARMHVVLAAGVVFAVAVGTVTGSAAVAGSRPAGAAMARVASSVPSPTVEGPILPASGISFLGSTLFSLSQVGYEESEYFVSGTATSYTSTAPLAKDGKWT